MNNFEYIFNSVHVHAHKHTPNIPHILGNQIWATGNWQCECCLSNIACAVETAYNKVVCFIRDWIQIVSVVKYLTTQYFHHDQKKNKSTSGTVEPCYEEISNKTLL